MGQPNFEVSTVIDMSNVVALTEEQFQWLPYGTVSERYLKDWILASVRRVIGDPSLAESFVICQPFSDGKLHTSHYHTTTASQYGSEFRNATNHEIGLQWAVEIAKNGQEALNMLTHQKDMSTGTRVVRDYGSPNVLYWVGGCRSNANPTPMSHVYRVNVFYVYEEFQNFVPALSYSV